MLSTIAEIQKGQGLGSGYKWLAGLVSRICMTGLSSGSAWGSKYHVTDHSLMHTTPPDVRLDPCSIIYM